MLKRIILFFLIFYFSIQLKGQQPIPIIRGIDFPTDFILPNGKLVFTLPEGDQVVDKYPKEGTLNQITLGEHPLQVFSEGKAVVQRLDRSIYWINSKGIKVKEFGKRYSKMSAPIGGYCMAWEPIEGRRGENMMVFLDKNGVNAFGKQQFWEAAPFQEGLAAVQVEKNGTWGFIDATGKIALQPVNIAPEQIQRLYNFSEGLAKVEIKKSSRETNYVYINKKGEVILDLKKLYPDKKISSAAHFQEGHVAVSFSMSNTFEMY